MKKTIHLIAIFCIIASIFPKIACAKPIKVAVSILPLAEMVEQIGGRLVDVITMIPSGASPHTYEPTPKQMVKLKKARLYVKVGSGIEFERAWLKKLLAVNPQLKICDASKTITLIDMDIDDDHHDETTGYRDKDYDRLDQSRKDPHIWLSPEKAVRMIRNIRDALVQIDPDHKTRYESEATNYIVLNLAVKEIIEKKLRKLKNRSFLVFHPSWGYFAHAFNLHQVPIEQEGKTFSAKHLAQTISFAKNHQIKAVFVSPQFSKRHAKTIAKEIKGVVIAIDPLAKDYLTNLKQVSKKIAKSSK